MTGSRNICAALEKFEHGTTIELTIAHGSGDVELSMATDTDGPIYPALTARLCDLDDIALAGLLFRMSRELFNQMLARAGK